MLKLLAQDRFVISMNTNFHLHVTPRTSVPVLTRFCSLSTSVLSSPATIGQSSKYLRIGKALKSNPPTLFHVLAALACGLFLVAAPSKAQYVTPSSYMNDLYIWWENASPYPYDIQDITVRATFLGGSAHPTQTGVTPSIAIFE